MPRRHRALLVALLTAALLWVTAPAFAALPDDVRSLVNQARADQGLPALAHDGGVAGVAQAWAQYMADSEDFRHNPDFGSQIPGGATAAAENIAMNSAPTPAAMHGQLMNSAGHRANILGDFTHIGVGYATTGSGTGYLVQVFATYPDRDGGSSDPAPSPAQSSPAQSSPSPSQSPSPSGPEPSQRPTGEASPAPSAQEVPAGWLGLGSSGQEVATLQQALASHGYDVVVDGDFGPNTRAAVLAFQTDSGLRADGLVGPQTRAALDDVANAAARSEDDPPDDERADDDETGDGAAGDGDVDEPRDGEAEQEREPEVRVTAVQPSGPPQLEAQVVDLRPGVLADPPVGALVATLGTAIVALGALALLRRRLLMRD